MSLLLNPKALLDSIMDSRDCSAPGDSGDIIGDLNSRRRRVQGMETAGNQQVIKAQAPVAEMLNYQSTLNSITAARGSFHLQFSHYDPVLSQLAQKVVEQARAEGRIRVAEEDRAWRDRSMPRYWVIAPYSFEEPELFDRVWKYDLEHNLISIGWRQFGDASSLSDDQLRALIDRTHAEEPPSVKTLYRRMYRDFYHSIKIGDVIIARRGRKVIAGVGTVARRGYYEHDKNVEALGLDRAYSNHLDVRWEPAPRDKAFPAIMFGMQTLYEIPKEKFDSLLTHEPWRDAQPADLREEEVLQPERATNGSTEPTTAFETLGPLTIGKLTAANNTPLYINRDAQITEATSEMRLNDYSQLPVMQNLRKVDGWISWKSIGKAGGACLYIRECMDKHVVKLWNDTPLLDAVRTISEEEVVLIQSRETNEICGLVTTSDLAEEYHTLAEPFLLIREIENRLRDLIEQAQYSLPVLQSVRNTGESKRRINRCSDLSFGETLWLLKNPAHWSSISLDVHNPHSFVPWSMLIELEIE